MIGFAYKQPPVLTQFGYSGPGPVPYAAIDCFGAGAIPYVRNGGKLRALLTPSIVGSSAALVNKHGLRSYNQTVASSATEYISLTTGASIKSVPFTYLIVASVDLTSVVNTLAYSSAGAGSGPMQFRVNATANLQLLKSGVISIVAGTLVVPQDRPFVCAVSYDGTTGVVYLNGKRDASAASAQTFTGANAFALLGGNGLNTNENNPSRLGLFCMWPSVLSPTLLCSLTANPWQLYQAPKIIKYYGKGYRLNQAPNRASTY
jgi:hypothetical protein